MTAETVIGRGRVVFVELLQWSRGLLTAETKCGALSCVCVSLASMEPRSFDRGDHGGTDGPPAVAVASMEPRSFDRGDHVRLCIDSSLPCGFNGAAVF